MHQMWGHAFSLVTALQQALFMFQNKLLWWSQWRPNPSQIGNTESYLLNHSGCLRDARSSIPKEDPWKPFKWCCHFPSKIIVSTWRFFYVVGPNPCHNRLGVRPRKEVGWEKQRSTTSDRNGDVYSWSWVSGSLLALELPSQGPHASYLSKWQGTSLVLKDFSASTAIMADSSFKMKESLDEQQFMRRSMNEYLYVLLKKTTALYRLSSLISFNWLHNER